MDWRADSKEHGAHDLLGFIRQQLAQQLAYQGVGELILVDADHASKTDHHRLVGLTPSDVWFRRRKTRVIRRAIRRIGMGTRRELTPERMPGPNMITALTRADVIVGCADNLHARADLQELAWRFAIPCVDVGVNIRAIEKPDPDGRASWSAGTCSPSSPGASACGAAASSRGRSSPPNSAGPTATTSRIARVRPRW
ncbi:MAG: ThiF family adenylyltransferase [Candidatus Rokubacteria bacterium]|nr:ThiF family adenylyltransferase [Candidatus Rokubacteria bacterium]